MSGAPLVKICGLRDAQTAFAISDFGLPVDYAGFIFAPSKRRVEPHEARSVMEAFRAQAPEFVGVFVNPLRDELDRVLAAAALDVIQLHGDETPAFCREVKERYSRVKVWKALGVRADEAHDDEAVSARLDPYADAVDAVLLDAWDPHVGGGTGNAFRWEVIPAYRAWADRKGIVLFIAGGLNADNVGDLLGRFPVGAVDVSSGVETDGRKDIEKIRKFTERVKGK
ncbi:phosphoribosylanthranilate isomerase [Paenibacillus alkalitolerans]|uniref:phosphoribosylanthranilate isomerase n=1 Tax=Paenibacillus alkalitolerans TaxID=2799335 RepID=UPI0018F2D189|nr:phosphoribosylanthranilate isomerase [Paenibacillus alkalitolerans]